jgi:hypothetical protein
MIQIIPVIERTEEQKDTDKIFYIPNKIETEEGTVELNSMSDKYNYAIENIVLKQEDPNICFHHSDAEIRTALDVCDYKLNNMFADGTVGCAGLIGTIQLEASCTWWAPRREQNGAGYIIQGGYQPKLDENKQPIKNEKGETLMEAIEYPMADFPGNHDYMATVDGCCMFFPKRVFEEGLRFDTNLKEYHFYDCDICLQLLERGQKVTTIDIVVKHQSSGIPSKNFNDLRLVFFNKWNKKVHGQWPISRISKFFNE